MSLDPLAGRRSAWGDCSYDKNVAQGFSLFREPLSVAHGMLLIRRLTGEPRRFQSFQAAAKKILGFFSAVVVVQKLAFGGLRFLRD